MYDNAMGTISLKVGLMFHVTTSNPHRANTKYHRLSNCATKFEPQHTATNFKIPNSAIYLLAVLENGLDRDTLVQLTAIL